jgi:NitT/TauT family transport system permease protein
MTAGDQAHAGSGPAGGNGRNGRPGATALAAARRAGPVVLPVVGLALALTGWWGATELFDISSFLLPPPDEVLAELDRLFAHLLEQAQWTLYETVVGFGITVAGGLLIGTLIASSRVVDQMASPWLVAFNAIPKVAFAPLLIIWLDLPTKPRIAMVVLICFFPIVLATVTGLTKTPAELVELGRSLDASRWQTFVKLRFPYALPQIFVGLKVAMPLAVIGAVIGEFAGGRLGLGQVIAQAGGAGNTALAFAAITVLAVMSIVLFYALVLLERLLLPWVRATTG